jgi:hypothetical protein
VAFSAVVCVLLAGRRQSLPRLAISITISQFAFHLLFGVGGGPGGAAGAGSAVLVETGGHHGHLLLRELPDAVAGPVHAGHDSSAMWVMHAIAAVLTIVLVRRGERAVVAVLTIAGAGILSLVRLAVAVFLEPLPEPSTLRPRGLPIVDRLRDLGVLLGGLRHRGPPVMAAAHS